MALVAILAGLAAGGALATNSPLNPTARSAGGTPECPPSNHSGWEFREGFKPFRIWYRKSDGDEGVAKNLTQQMDLEIWPRLTELMNTKPLSEPLDICLMPHVQVENADVRGLTVTKRGCDPSDSSVFIPLSEGDKALSEQALRDSLAHEFMHVLQHTLSFPCKSDYGWWREASATWAIDYVYPHDNLEQEFADDYLKTMDQSLDAVPTARRPYGAYLFALFIARELDPQRIAEIWHKAENEPLLQAFDDALPGGLKKQWKRFALEAWNEDPANDFQKWDDLKAGESKLTKPFDLQPGSDLGLTDVGQLPHLSASYYSFKVKQGVRTLSVTLPTLYGGGIGSQKPDPHAAVQAIVETAGGNAKPEDWTSHQYKNYCFALPHQHITGLTLVFSNSSPTDDFNSTEPAYVVSTNVGCASWHGTVSGEVHYSDGRNVKETADVTYKRAHSSPDDPVLYAPVSGSGDWQASTTNCNGTGSGTWSVQSSDGYITMFWNAHNTSFFPTRGYGGTLGGPFLLTWQATCPPDTSPSTFGAAGFGPWSSGGNPRLVSPDGLHMQGTYGDSTSDGSESWHWSLSSSG